MKTLTFLAICLFSSFITIAQQKPLTAEEIQAKLQSLRNRYDSMVNASREKAALKNSIVKNQTPAANQSGISNINQSAGGNSFDGTKIKIPPRNQKQLSLIPTKPLDSAALASFAKNLKKLVIPELKRMFNTPDINTDGMSAEACDHSGIAAWYIKKPDIALIYSLSALEKDAGDPTIGNNTGSILTLCGFDPQAATVLEAVDKKKTGNSTVDNNLGQAYINMGEVEKAKQYLLQTVASSPYHPNANEALAFIFQAEGNTAVALKYAENSVRGGFIPEAWKIVIKNKPNARLMDYIKHRYKPTEYFNPHKYEIPEQCRKVEDAEKLEQEYRSYNAMLMNVRDKYEKLLIASDKEIETHQAEDYQKQLKIAQEKHLIPLRPFGAFSNGVLTSIQQSHNEILIDFEQWKKDFKSAFTDLESRYNIERDKIAKEYEKASEPCGEGNPCLGLDEKFCKQFNELGNQYLPQFADLTHNFQQKVLQRFHDYFDDSWFWCYMASANDRQYHSYFYNLVKEYVIILQQIVTTKIIKPGCNLEELEEEAKKEYEFEMEHCPLNVEIPIAELEHGKFEGFAAKVNLDCEALELEVGEGLIGNVSHNLQTGSSTLAFGAGLSADVPVVKMISAGVKMQFYITFDRSGGFSDLGVLWEAEMDVKGMNKPDAKVGWQLGLCSGWNFNEGPFKGVANKLFGIEDAKQINKNVKLYPSNNKMQE
jgi:hypothetical protein